MKSSEARGPFGAWLRRARTERFDNVPAAIAAMKREIGYGIAPSVWAELESGSRRPSEEQRDRLTRFFGSAPEPVSDTLTQALERQTEAIRAQTLVLRELLAVLRGAGTAAPDDLAALAAEEGRLSVDAGLAEATDLEFGGHAGAPHDRP